jgi:AhpD family alkylhydroperoxidase
MTAQTIELKPRMNHPVQIFPEAMRALQALGKAAHNPAVPLRTLMLVELRASQINGCSVCVDMHSRDLKKHGDADERIFGVSAWRENPAFDAAERAALALTEELTRISDRPNAVSDEVWAEAARHYDEAGLATLLIAIANINVWNRLNVGVRQAVGAWAG